MTTSVLESTSSSVATITLNAPKTYNAFDDSLIKELTEAIQRAENDPNIRLIVLRGNGKHFCAGANLTWMKSMLHASKDDNIEDAKKLNHLMLTLHDCQTPTLAVVQGNAYGGGVGLIACCKMVIASHESMFCFSETKLGLIPAVITPFVVQAIGLRMAQALFLTATPFDAIKAERIGLCHTVVPETQLEDEVQRSISQICHNGPQSLIAANNLLRTLYPINVDAMDKTINAIAHIRRTPEAQEGMSAFLEKRPPSWHHTPSEPNKESSS